MKPLPRTIPPIYKRITYPVQVPCEGKVVNVQNRTLSIENFTNAKFTPVAGSILRPLSHPKLEKWVHIFHISRFQVLLYFTSNWHYFVFVDWIHLFISPRIRTFVEKCSHYLFSEKKGSKSGGCSLVSELKLRSTSSTVKNFADEITWIAWKTEQNLEIWKIWTHFSSFESGKVLEKLILLPTSQPICRAN